MVTQSKKVPLLEIILLKLSINSHGDKLVRVT